MTRTEIDAAIANVERIVRLMGGLPPLTTAMYEVAVAQRAQLEAISERARFARGILRGDPHWDDFYSTEPMFTELCAPSSAIAGRGEAMTNKDVEKKASEIAGHIFSNGTMRTMLYEMIVDAFSTEDRASRIAREDHERRRYSGWMP